LYFKNIFVWIAFPASNTEHLKGNSNKIYYNCFDEGKEQGCLFEGYKFGLVVLIEKGYFHGFHCVH